MPIDAPRGAAPLTLANIRPVKGPGVNYTRLALPHEIDTVRIDLTSRVGREVKDLLLGWRIVNLTLRGIPSLHLVADSIAWQAPYVTSGIVGLDIDSGLVITRSGSLYGLLDPGVGEPPEHHIRFFYDAVTEFWCIRDLFELVE